MSFTEDESHSEKDEYDSLLALPPDRGEGGRWAKEGPLGSPASDLRSAPMTEGDNQSFAFLWEGMRAL
jgi:hypothetical protein